jgi:hypothetical protein
MKKNDIFIALLVTLFALIVGVLLTSCATPAKAEFIDETKPHVHYAPQFEENNNRLWAGSPVFADGTTSRACFNSSIASYYIYDPQVGTWMAMVCQLADGYGIVYATPNAAPNSPFAIEVVLEYDAYLLGKGYSK